MARSISDEIWGLWGHQSDSARMAVNRLAYHCGSGNGGARV